MALRPIIGLLVLAPFLAASGTWSLEGNVVEFSHEADTFLRDMAFQFEDGRLSGDETFGDVRVRIVMERR